MQEFRELCKRHDIAGSAIMVSPNGAEFANFPHDPTWSCLYYEGAGRWRIRAKMKTGGPEEHRRAELTAHMLYRWRDCAAQNWDFADKLVKVLNQHLDIEDGSPRPIFEA
jgi:hypothetical protein